MADSNHPTCATCMEWTREKGWMNDKNPLKSGECTALPTGDYACSNPVTDETFYCAYHTPKEPTT